MRNRLEEEVIEAELDREDSPAKAAWDKYKASGNAYSDPARVVFSKGWNAALAWIPFRIAQFREIDEAQRKEIEELKEKLSNVGNDSI